MKIILNGEEIKKFMLFTSKHENRLALEGISIKNDGGILEIVATDGRALLRYRRKLGAGEQLTEGEKITLKLPKLKYKKYNYAIEKVGEKYFIQGLGEESICQKIDNTYPNYNVIIEGWEKLPFASDFAMFSAENIKRFEAIADNYELGLPKARNRTQPHFWEHISNDLGSPRYLIVLMPKTI